jgi:Cu2+-exporting ATPase
MKSDTIFSEQQVVKQRFPVLDMTCAACAVSVESVLQSVDGVLEANVNFAAQSVTVSYQADKTNPARLKSALTAVGYGLDINEGSNESTKEAQQLKALQALKARAIWSSVMAFPVVVIGMFFMDMPYGNWVMMVLSAPVVFYFGRRFFVQAFKQARFGRANMDTLVALSTGVAWLFSAFNTIYPSWWHQQGLHPHVYFEAAAVVVAFISLGKWLEERAKSFTSSAIKKLMGLQPQTVWVFNDKDEAEEKSLQLVQRNDRLLVKPGERIPVDGTVIFGSSYVEESTITGEPIPVLKEKNATVFAGTINQKGRLHILAEKVGEETMLAGIIRTVQEAQGSKAPVQKQVDKIAGVFVPVVMGISVLTFIAWIIWGGSNAFSQALLTSITVLVIACPCALGLATPTAIMVGMGRGAEQQILIKDADSLETAHRVDFIVLDKTGTITEGRPEVHHEHWLVDGSARFDAGAVLLSMEQSSEHPLAEAMVRHLRNQGYVPTELDRFESLTGLGVTAEIGLQQYRIGNIHLLREVGIEIPEQISVLAQQWAEGAETVVYFIVGKQLLAVFGLSDRIKVGASEAIIELQKMGIEVVMLTGDNPQTAAAVAKSVGIERYRSEVKPAEKAAFVQQQKLAGRTVAMVGDGINDSEALAQADISIAMGKGSDIAMEVAKITLMGSDLKSIPRAIRLSKKTVSTIRQNLFWAFIYNLVGIPIAAGALYPWNGFLLDPMLAGAAMALSSVSVVANSLRLKRVRLV